MKHVELPVTVSVVEYKRLREADERVRELEAEVAALKAKPAELSLGCEDISESTCESYPHCVGCPAHSNPFRHDRRQKDCMNCEYRDEGTCGNPNSKFHEAACLRGQVCDDWEAEAAASASPSEADERICALETEVEALKAKLGEAEKRIQDLSTSGEYALRTIENAASLIRELDGDEDDDAEVAEFVVDFARLLGLPTQAEAGASSTPDAGANR